MLCVTKIVDLNKRTDNLIHLLADALLLHIIVFYLQHDLFQYYPYKNNSTGWYTFRQKEQYVSL